MPKNPLPPYRLKTFYTASFHPKAHAYPSKLPDKTKAASLEQLKTVSNARFVPLPALVDRWSGKDLPETGSAATPPLDRSLPSVRRARRSGWWLALGLAAVLLPIDAVDAADVEVESRKKKQVQPSYYQPPASYSTQRDPDPPRYTKQADKTWAKFLEGAGWLDIGLDYRFRYEYRDDDIRRTRPGSDEPELHRTRLYLGIKEIIDPFRFAFELQDARRYNSRFVRDNRDVNEFEVIRLYGELYFKHFFGYDDLGTPRPLSLRGGIFNFEFLDRRLIGNNQWRNTANTFQGFQGAIGQERNDWSVDLLAVQPRDRLKYEFDRPIDGQWFYAVIGHWRRWSKIITIEPYYLALQQTEQPGGVVDRMIHSPGTRLYGKFGNSGFDFDMSGIYQFGHNGALAHRAWGGNIEIGYSPKLPWKPRVSAFYGYASGDDNPNDGEDNRFERFFGFSRPWSANDYIVFENISAPKVRVELNPTKDLRIDFGYNWYWLASDTDRFSTANNARDRTGRSGSYVGHEFDIRGRYALSDLTEFAVGYSHFVSGGFIRKTVRRDDTDFFYFEFTQRFF